jgi:chemotaxis-related protein WspD
VTSKDETAPIACWRDKGVFGNASCPDLAKTGHCRHCPVYASAGRHRLDRELPPGYLEERTAVMAREKQEAKTGGLSVIIFRLKNELLALKTIFFQEAAEKSVVHAIPLRDNRVFRGLVNINGELLLCVSVSDLLDLALENQEAVHTAFERMVVVRREGARFVFPVDEIIGVNRIAADEVRDVPATLSRSARALSSGIFSLGDETVGLLDEDQLFSALTRSLAP